jgi:phage terminase large subunit
MSEFVVTTAIKKMLRLNKRKRIIQGGTSAGKTFGVLPILIDKAIREPLLEISVVSESIPHLRRGALKDFLKIMMMTNRYRDIQFNKSTLKYTFANGSYIEFFSVDQPDKLRGARRNILYINECNNVPFEAYNQLAIRTSGDIWLDYNPTNEF